LNDTQKPLTLTGCGVTKAARLTHLTVAACRPVLTLVTLTGAVDTRAVIVTSAVSGAVNTCPPYVTHTLEVRGSRALAMDAVIVTSET